MIDRVARHKACSLLRSFTAGEINSDDLESDWPYSKEDKALDAVASMVWLHYDDFKPRKMIGADKPSIEERLLLERYAAFLESDILYEWPHYNFLRLAGLGSLVPLSLGLLKPIDNWIKSRNRKFDAEMDRIGDWNLWPFKNSSEWDGTPIPPFIRD